MSRLVPFKGGPAGNAKIVGAGAPNDPTPTRDRIEAISKYVPAEILAFYVPVVPAITLIKRVEWQSPLQWAAFLFAWVLVPAYFLWIGKDDQRRKLQAAVSSAAFPIWAYVTNRNQGPLASWYDDAFAVVLMLLFSLGTAFILPKRSN